MFGVALALAVLLGAAAAGCGVGASTGPSVKLREAPPEADGASPVAAEVRRADEPVKAIGDAAATESVAGDERPAISPRLGFRKDGQAVALGHIRIRAALERGPDGRYVTFPHRIQE